MAKKKKYVEAEIKEVAEPINQDPEYEIVRAEDGFLAMKVVRKNKE